GSLRLRDLTAGAQRCCPVERGGNARGRREVNGFLVGDAGDVEKQKFFVERLGDFIVAKHRSLEHRRSDTAADSDGDHAGEQVEGRTTHEVKELLFRTPYGGLCGLGLLLGRGNEDRGCSPLVLCRPCGCALLRAPYMNHVYTSSGPRIYPFGPPDPTGDRVIDQRKGGQKRGILIHLKYISDETVETPGPH